MRSRDRGELPKQRVFEELFGEHLDALYRTALRLCRGRESDAEDLLQEAALRAFRGFSRLRRQEAGRAWLFTILETCAPTTTDPAAVANLVRTYGLRDGR